ncbi:MAG: hypothetical protein QOH31_5561 [Verrucomicrobiota bacterium]|jgi:hypothetical protein
MRRENRFLNPQHFACTRIWPRSWFARIGEGDLADEWLTFFRAGLITYRSK